MKQNYKNKIMYNEFKKKKILGVQNQIGYQVILARFQCFWQFSIKGGANQTKDCMYLATWRDSFPNAVYFQMLDKNYLSVGLGQFNQDFFQYCKKESLSVPQKLGVLLLAS